LRGDQKARAEFYQSALLNGWMCPNEVRREESLPPIPGGDVFRAPVNTAPIAGAPVPAKKPEPAPAAPPVGGEVSDTNLGPIGTETGDSAVA
jgi:hypothetical protein